MGVQTDRTIMTNVSSSSRPALISSDSDDAPNAQQVVFEQLTVDDLTAIIRSSQMISGDVMLPATLVSIHRMGE